MRKSIAILICLLTAFVICSCGEKVTEDETTEAEVQTQVQTEAQQTEEDIVENGKNIGKNYYDNGKLTKEEYFENDVGVSRTVEYGEDGSKTESSMKEGKKISETVKNSNGEMLSSEEFDENGSVKSTYEGKNIVLTESFDKDRNLSASTKINYDDLGQRVDSTTENAKGELLFRTEYQYENGKLSGFVMYGSDGEVYRYGSYDEDGHLSLYDAYWNPLNDGSNS